MFLLFDMAEVNDKSQSTHQSPNIGNFGGSTQVFNNAWSIDVGHRPLPPASTGGLVCQPTTSECVDGSDLILYEKRR